MECGGTPAEAPRELCVCATLARNAERSSADPHRPVARRRVRAASHRHPGTCRRVRSLRFPLVAERRRQVTVTLGRSQCPVLHTHSGLYPTGPPAYPIRALAATPGYPRSGGTHNVTLCDARGLHGRRSDVGGVSSRWRLPTPQCRLRPAHPGHAAGQSRTRRTRRRRGSRPATREEPSFEEGVRDAVGTPGGPMAQRRAMPTFGVGSARIPPSQKGCGAAPTRVSADPIGPWVIIPTYGTRGGRQTRTQPLYATPTHRKSTYQRTRGRRATAGAPQALRWTCSIWCRSGERGWGWGRTSSASCEGHVGCCLASYFCHESGAQSPRSAVVGLSGAATARTRSAPRAWCCTRFIDARRPVTGRPPRAARQGVTERAAAAFIRSRRVVKSWGAG